MARRIHLIWAAIMALLAAGYAFFDHWIFWIFAFAYALQSAVYLMIGMKRECPSDWAWLYFMNAALGCTMPIGILAWRTGYHFVAGICGGGAFGFIAVSLLLRIVTRTSP